MECVWANDGTCARCGLAGYAVPGGGMAPRNCRPGLGDMVAAGLSAVGITKDRAQAVAQAVGLQDCGCAERQRRLNELGQKLGIGSHEPTRP
jgi:hypothetical protein